MSILTRVSNIISSIHYIDAKNSAQTSRQALDNIRDSIEFKNYFANVMNKITKTSYSGRYTCYLPRLSLFTKNKDIIYDEPKI